MFHTRFVLLIGFVLAGLIMAACATIPGQGENPATQSTSEILTASNQDDGKGINTIVDITPLGEDNLLVQGENQTEPGASPDDPDTSNDVDMGERAMAGPTTTYKDDNYKFQINYPTDFVFTILTADKLSSITPEPDSAFTFMNPIIAASDVIDTEIADLEIRVYKIAGTVDSLESWLKSVGLLNSDSAAVESFDTPEVHGLQVCGSTMIFPNCSAFVLGNRLVYQFRIASIDGEDMMNTFTILP